LLYWQYERTTKLAPLQHRGNLSQEAGPVELAFGASRQAKLPVALTGRAVLRTIKILQKSRASLIDWTLSRACYHEWAKEEGRTRDRTWITGIRIRCANHYTIQPMVEAFSTLAKHIHLLYGTASDPQVTTFHPLASANACLQQLDVE
jgi:hypothetical protein